MCSFYFRSSFYKTRFADFLIVVLPVRFNLLILNFYFPFRIITIISTLLFCKRLCYTISKRLSCGIQIIQDKVIIYTHELIYLLRLSTKGHFNQRRQVPGNQNRVEVGVPELELNVNVRALSGIIVFVSASGRQLRLPLGRPQLRINTCQKPPV